MGRGADLPEAQVGGGEAGLLFVFRFALIRQVREITRRTQATKIPLLGTFNQPGVLGYSHDFLERMTDDVVTNFFSI